MKHKGIFKRLSLLTLLLIAGFTSAMAQSLYMEGFKINAGETKTVTIDLASNGYDVYGLQTDIVLSNGLYLDGDPVAVEGVMSNPSISSKWMDNKTIRVVMFSMNGEIFSGQKNVIQLNVGCTENFYGGSIQLKNSRLTVSNDGYEVSVPEYKAIVTTDNESVLNDDLWIVPEPQGLTFVDNIDVYEHYILYNPATKMFFASGNGWYTMASLRTFGMEIWLDDATEPDAPEGSYRLCDNNVNNPSRQTGEGDMFTDDGDATWVDHASQANYSWIYENENGYVRLQNAAFVADHPEYEGTYLGFDGNYELVTNNYGSGSNRDANSAILRHVNPSAEGVSVDWKAVTVESYEEFILSDAYQAYTEGFDKCLAAKALKAAIEEAMANYVDVSEAVAIYNNAESEAWEMQDVAAALRQLVEVKVRLKEAIQNAEAQGFPGADEYKAVLYDLYADYNQVQNAISNLQYAIIEWGKNNASLENPSDMTNMIVNPTFDNGDCTTGWYGDLFGRGGTVADGAEHYSKNYNTYQKIYGLAPGVYAVGVNGFYRAGNYGGEAENHFRNGDAKYSKLYAIVGGRDFETAIADVLSGAQAWQQGVGDVEVAYTDPVNEEEVTVYVPNTMAAGDYYFHTLNQYANKLYVLVDESGELTIGVRKSNYISGDWSLFDDFSLTYYGQAADACQFYMNEAMKNYGEYNIEAGVLYTEAYLTAYQQAYSGEEMVTTMEEVYAVLDVIEEAKAALDYNIQLWKDYQDVIARAVNMLFDPTYERVDEINDLADYLEFDCEYILESVALTNEELENEIAKVQDLITLIENKSKEFFQEGDDVTYLIKNPGFDDDADINSGAAEGWTIERGTGSNITRGPLGQGNKDLMEAALGTMNYCFEAWHRYNWDVWQEINDLPVGIYELSVQGYVRCEMGGYTKGDELVAPYTSPVYLYMNNALSQFPSVYSESPEDYGQTMVEVETWYQEEINGLPYPNSMGGAAQCFSWGMYKSTAYGLVAENGGSFRIGVKMIGNSDWWCIWDSFKLIYHDPTNADLIRPILEEAIAKIDLSKPMGKDVYERVSQVKADAQAAIAANDGAAMFAALSAVYDLNAEIMESVALFEQLAAANEGLLNRLYSEFAVNTQAIAEAEALYNTIESGIENHTITDAQAKEYMEMIELLYIKVVLPNNIEEASDNNPIDVTGVIKTPSFENDWGDNSADGWTNPGNLGNDDTQKSALAMEFWQIDFDMYQDIQGLPEGTYMISVDAWCRVGNNEENYNRWLYDNKATLAYLYGMSGDGKEYDARVANLMKAGDVLMESTGYDGETEFSVDGTTYWLPGSLVSGKGLIELNPGVYTNTVIVKVGADGRLRIGIKKYENYSNSWVVLDDFRLTYFGKNSNKQPGEEINIDLTSVINEANRLLGMYMQASLQAELLQLVNTYQGATDYAMMEEGYRLLTNCIERVRENINAYANLVEVINAVKQRLANGENMDEDVVAEATACVTTAEAAYLAREINTKVANDYTNKLYNLLDQLYAVFATVTLEEAGTLEEVLYEVAGDPWNLQGLKVKGDMNDNDLYFIRDLYDLRLLDLAGANLVSMPNYIFEYHDNLQKVELPATLLYVGYGAFLGCYGLESLTLHAAVPPYGHDRVNWDWGYNLYVPAVSVQAYQNSYNWNNWNIQGIDELPEMYNAVTDYEVTWPEAEDYKPDMRIGQYNLGSSYDYVYGAVTVNADKNNTVSLGQFTIVYDPNIELTRRYSWGYSDYSSNGSLLNYAENMRADNVTVDYWVRRDRWTFFSLPFDAQVSEIGLNFENTPFVIRKYDAAARAAGNMDETWVNMTADSVLHAGEGYILQSTALEYNEDYREYNGFFFKAMQTTNKNNIFASDDVEVPLKQFASEFVHNQNWNLIGNPYPCYYNIQGMQTNAPITVWNQGSQSYEAYTPLDDVYVLNPGEAFFVQRPVNESSIVFIEEGRQARRDQVNYNLVAGARSAMKAADRYVFNITLSDGETTDRTRVVLNEEAKAGYEQDKDASKFMSLNDEVAQIYSVADTKYAINERPMANGEVKLGVHFGKQGTYTIALNTKVDAEVVLVDLLTGKEIRLDGSEGYTFEANEGDTEDRFVVRFAGGELTGIQTIANGNADNEKYYNLNGMQIEQPKKGLYLKNGKKVVVK